MKATLMSIIPTLLFLGCTSTASQARLEVSTNEKANEIEKVETSGAPSIHSVEALAEALDAMLTPADEVTEPVAVEEPDEVVLATTATPTASSGAATSSSSSSTTSSSSTSSSAPAAPSTDAAPNAASADDAEAAAQSSDTSVIAPAKAPAKRVASIAKIVNNALSSVGLIPRAISGGETNAGAASSDASIGENGDRDDEDTESDEAAPASSGAVTPRAPASTAEVLQAVSQLRGLSGWTIIPFAHLRRGERHAVIAWPAINSAGQLVDATVVGICLQETDEGQLEECGRRWVVRDAAASRAATIEALGGSDYQAVGRSSGVALDDLGPRLASLGTEFSQAVAARNSAGARQAAMAATRLLPLDRVAYENGVARLLYAAAQYNGRLEHVSTERNGDSATLVFHVRRGLLRLQTITATARPVSGTSDRWIITSYR